MWKFQGEASNKPDSVKMQFWIPGSSGKNGEEDILQLCPKPEGQLYQVPPTQEEANSQKSD